VPKGCHEHLEGRRGSRKWGISESKKARDAIVENSENLYDFKFEYTKVIFNAKSKIRNI